MGKLHSDKHKYKMAHQALRDWCFQRFWRTHEGNDGSSSLKPHVTLPRHQTLLRKSNPVASSTSSLFQGHLERDPISHSLTHVFFHLIYACTSVKWIRLSNGNLPAVTGKLQGRGASAVSNAGTTYSECIKCSLIVSVQRSSRASRRIQEYKMLPDAQSYCFCLTLYSLPCLAGALWRVGRGLSVPRLQIWR